MHKAARVLKSSTRQDHLLCDRRQPGFSMPASKVGFPGWGEQYLTEQTRLPFKPTLGQGFYHFDPFIESRWFGDK